MKTQLFAAALAMSLATAAHAAPCSTTTDKDASTPLLYSARKGDTSNVRCLLDGGAAVDAADDEGHTALMSAAAFNGHTDAVRLLIERGAQVNAADKNGNTALSLAQKGKHTDIVQMLRAAGARG